MIERGTGDSSGGLGVEWEEDSEWGEIRAFGWDSGNGTEILTALREPWVDTAFLSASTGLLSYILLSRHQKLQLWEKEAQMTNNCWSNFLGQVIITPPEVERIQRRRVPPTAVRAQMLRLTSPERGRETPVRKGDGQSGRKVIPNSGPGEHRANLLCLGQLRDWQWQSNRLLFGQESRSNWLW